jgi:branched-chain amino acid aminotransferase
MNNTELKVYLNGEMVTLAEARVPVFDRGFMRGDGLFETIRAYGGRIFRIDDHLARLDHGMEVLRFPVRSADLNLKAAAENIVSVNGLMDARVRVQVTRGVGTTEFTTTVDTPPTVVITADNMVEKPWPSPLHAVISSIRRDARSPFCAVKTINYVPSLVARMEAEEVGADEAIFLNYDGSVAEGCASNIFLVNSGRLFTPDLASGVLPGITRKVLLEIAEDIGIPHFEERIELQQLYSADEIFMTSSTREVAPVATLDGRMVGIGKFDAAKRLEEEYRKRAEIV